MQSVYTVAPAYYDTPYYIAAALQLLNSTPASMWTDLTNATNGNSALLLRKQTDWALRNVNLTGPATNRSISVDPVTGQAYPPPPADRPAAAGCEYQHGLVVVNATTTT